MVPAELGRVASHYYIRHSSIVVFNEHLKPHMGEADILAMIALSSGAGSALMLRTETLYCGNAGTHCKPSIPSSSMPSSSISASLLPTHFYCLRSLQSLRTWL